MAKIWEKWYDEVMPDVSGVGLDVAKNAIRNAAIEFCDKSWAWRVDHNPIDAVLNTGSYAYAPPANTKVAMPLRVWFNGQELEALSTHEINRLYPKWDTVTGTRPFYFVQEQLESLLVVPAPNAALVGAITLKVAIKPTRASASIDDQIWEKYLEQIACGAKAKLRMMKRKPWSDPAQGQAELAQFAQYIAEAKLAADRGFVRSTGRVRAHFF
jgi:hypothetical protein